MDWAQFLILLITIGGLFKWQRDDMKTIEADMKQFREMWLQETKDFHKRLCEIEAARK